MMTPSSSRLQDEITRLNTIIDALISQNKTLLAENSSWKVRSGSVETPSSGDLNAIAESCPRSSVELEESGRTSAPLPGDLEGNGRTSPRSSAELEKNGRTSAPLSVDLEECGRTISRLPSDLEQNGRTNAPLTGNLEENGRTSARLPGGVKGSGRTDTHVPVAKIPTTVSGSYFSVPEIIELNTYSALGAHRVLRTSGMPKVKRSGLNNMISILVYLHNNKSGGHRELRKITRLSEGGLNKCIMSMKKRGFIVKESYGRFTLAPAGCEKIKQMFAKPGLPSV